MTDSFGEWAPGMQPRFYPDGVARFLPRKSRILMQVHYSALFGRVEPDRSQVGIYFAKGPVTRRLLSDDVRADAPFTIPAGAVSHTLRGRLGPLPSRAELVAILPHMHLLGRTMRVTARFPTGRDAAWSTSRTGTCAGSAPTSTGRPVVLPAGTVLELEATFDNSYANPQNPSEPLVDVHFGERTTDEMCMALLFWTVDGKNPGEKDAFFRGAVCFPRSPGSLKPLQRVEQRLGKPAEGARGHQQQHVAAAALHGGGSRGFRRSSRGEGGFALARPSLDQSGAVDPQIGAEALARGRPER